MTTPLSAEETLEREYLLIRAKILEIGAAIDRVERGNGAGSLTSDPRLHEISKALETLSKPIGSAADRAEAIQLIFSLPYRDSWRDEFEIGSTAK